MKKVTEESRKIEEKNDDYVMPLPKEEKLEEEAQKEPNKKPFWTVRLAGGLIDMFLIIAATLGLFMLFTKVTPMGDVLTNYQTQMVVIQDEYKLKELLPDSEETYGHKVYDDETEYSKYTTNHVYFDSDTGHNYVVVNNDNISNELKAAYQKAVKADENYNNTSFNYRMVEYGYTMLAAFIAMSVFVVVVPLVNKRRASIGKLAAGTMLINSKYQVPSKWYQIVGRFLFSFFIEFALPYLFCSGVSVFLMFIVPTLLFIISLISKQGRTLHDFVSRTKVIDKKTFVPLSEQ